ncbi:MAG: DUF2628 domain-containing protein [Pseudomonadota bacterium]
MATYTVWEHDKFGEDKIVRAVMVRDGFHWLAFLFAPLWLLARGMVVVLILFVAIVGGLNAAAALYLPDNASFAVGVVLSLWFGFEAAGLHRWALARRGWRMMGVVDAQRKINAEKRYFTERLGGDVARTAPAARTTPPPLPYAAQTPFQMPSAPSGPSVLGATSPPVVGLFPQGLGRDRGPSSGGRG